MRAIGGLVLLTLSMSAFGPKVAPAQFFDRMFNPKVMVSVEHPPSIPLKVSSVAIADAQGECAEVLRDRVEAAFVEASISVVDRQQLDSVVAEFKFQSSGLVEKKSAVEIGRLLGAQALIGIKVSKCDTSRSQQKVQNYVTGQANYIYVVEGILRGTVRTTDLLTGRVLTAKEFTGRATLKSGDGWPDDDIAKQRAEDDAVQQVRKMFVPWHERREIVFFNDQECNLRAAHQLLRGQDMEGALRAAEESNRTCTAAAGSKPKYIGRSFYNVAALQCLRRDYDNASTNFGQAMTSGVGEIASQAMAECSQAKRLEAEMSRYEEEQAAIAAKAETSSAAPVRSASLATPSAGSTLGAGGATGAGGGGDIEARLRRLDELLKKGLINQAEYTKRKTAILDEL